MVEIVVRIMFVMVFTLFIFTGSRFVTEATPLERTEAQRIEIVQCADLTKIKTVEEFMNMEPCPDVPDWCAAVTYPDGSTWIKYGQPIIIEE